MIDQYPRECVPPSRIPIQSKETKNRTYISSYEINKKLPPTILQVLPSKQGIQAHICSCFLGHNCPFESTIVVAVC